MSAICSIFFFLSVSIHFIPFAEAKQDLLQAVTHIKDMLNDPERVQGRLSRDEKVNKIKIFGHASH
jgi:hypothetical protein